MNLGFKNTHPIPSFIFFVSAFAFTLMYLHPAVLVINFICSAVYFLKLQGKKAVSFILKFILPMVLLVTLFNALFSHYGVTVLFKTFSGNNFTLEAFVYGLVSGIRLGTMLLWLQNFSECVTSEKILYLFGRFFPRVALILSMILRFIPLLSLQSEEINKAQKGVGIGGTSGSFTETIKGGTRRLSVLTSWTLEKGVDTANSMTARGYGLKGRTYYNRFVFTVRDTAILILSLSVLVLSFLMKESLYCSYNPIIAVNSLDIYSSFSLVFIFAVLLTPIIIDVREEKRWLSLK